MATTLGALFPAGVAVEVATDADADAGLLFPGELAIAADMVHARRLEFAAGRNAARRALARLGVAPAPLLPVAGDRDPAWPAGTTGSISHTTGLCAVAVALKGLELHAGTLQSIGLDVEGAAPLEDALVRTICRPDELVALALLPAPASGWPKLVFAMKEAAYKAWYPGNRSMLGFDEMHVELCGGQQFTAEVTGGRTGSYPVATGSFGSGPRFVWAGATVVTS